MTAQLRMKRSFKRLKKLLSRTPSEDLFRAVWSIDNIQSKFRQSESYFIDAPKEIVTTDFSSEYFFHKWILEQIINSSLFTSISPKTVEHKVFLLRNWFAFRRLFEDFLRYNNDCSGVFLEKNSVMVSMGRLGYQQLPWQAKNSVLMTVYRYCYLYDGPLTRQHLVAELGMKPSTYVSNILLMYLHFVNKFELISKFDVTIFGLSNDDFGKSLSNLSKPLKDLKSLAQKRRRDDPYGEYAESVFRKYPLVENTPGHYFCPLPQMLLFRLTEGLSFDFEQTDGNIRNEISKNLENFFIEYLSEMFPEFKISQEAVYGSKKKPKKTPDIRIKKSDETLVVIDCKTTRLSHSSKFGLVDEEELPRGSDEIIKGFLQIWRFCNDANSGLLGGEVIHYKCHGMILTFDSWVQLNKDRQKQFLEIANKLADEEKIPRASRISVTIISADEMQKIALQSDEETFLEFLETLHNPKYDGWMPIQIFQDAFSDVLTEKEFSIDQKISKYINIWSETDKMKTN